MMMRTEFRRASAGGVGSGPVQVVLEQRDRFLTGTLRAPGLRATISTAADNEGFHGTLEGQTGQGADGVPITMRANGDQMEGTVDRIPLVLRRPPIQYDDLERSASTAGSSTLGPSRSGATRRSRTR